MKRSLLVFFFFMVLLAVSCKRDTLEKGDWNPVVREALQELISDCGSESEGYDPDCRPYAVFDFDNTTIIGDIEVETMAFQIASLRFAIAPDKFYRTLLECVPNIDAPLKGLDAVSARMLATDLLNDYIFLHENYIAPKGDNLDQIRQTPEYQDFRAKLWALSAGVDATFGYETGCLWILRLFDGMSDDEISGLARDAASAALEQERIEDQVWTSPDLGEAGVVEVPVSLGIGITPEMKDLYRALREAGIDVYVCSASMEKVVATVACDPAFGLEVPRERVFGIRLQGGDYAPGYPHTHHEGKVELIRKYIAPHHGGAGPVLVAGDSEGDYNMLTEFDSMRVGLLLNCGRTDAFGKFVSTAQPPYFVQGRDKARKRFLPDDKIK